VAREHLQVEWTNGRHNLGAKQQWVKTDIGSKANKWLYNSPCCGADGSIPQAGSEKVRLRASGSHRMMNVVQAGSHLHGVLGSGPCTGSSCGTQGKDANNVMFYVDLDCSNPACVVSQTAKIAGPGFNAEFGTVGVDIKGNVGIVAMSATANTYLGLLSWMRQKTDPPNVFQGPTTVLAGTQPHTCMPKQDMMHLGSTVGILTLRDPRDSTKLWTTLQWSNTAAPACSIRGSCSISLPPHVDWDCRVAVLCTKEASGCGRMITRGCERFT
jgi:hypothetical protein